MTPSAVEAMVHIDPSDLSKAWLAYRGLVPLQLQTADPDLPLLTLREVLQIEEEDRLGAALTARQRYRTTASNQQAIKDANRKGKAAKVEDEATATALGRTKKQRVDKKSAAAWEADADRAVRFGVDDLPVTAGEGQVTLGVVDLFNVGIVSDRLDAFLQWDHLVVAGHHNHCAELQPFCQVHGADTGLPIGCLNMLVQHAERNASSGDGSHRPQYLGI